MELSEIIADARQAIAQASDPPSLDEVRVRFLGKKGALTAQLKSLGALPANERPQAGAAINEAKHLIAAVAHRPVDGEVVADTAQRIARVRASHEGKEGVAAFLEKRTAKWIIQ